MKSVFSYLGTSVVLHLLLFFGLWQLAVHSSISKYKDLIYLDLVQKPLENKNKESLNRVHEKNLDWRKKQVVDQEEKALNQEIPEDSYYLGKNNQKVLKQTIATNRGEFRNKRSSFQNPAKASLPLSWQELVPKIKASDFIKPFDPDAFQKKKSTTAQNPNNSQSPNPNPGLDSSQKNSEVSSTLDYIKELDPGLETLLSTREFVYYSYFSRIRQKLDQRWSPKVRENIRKILREGRSIASNSDKITRCLITLDRKGYVLKVQIIGNSGIHELDEAAIEAFKEASPFLNPPMGIIEQNGTILLRWDFILEA